MALSAFLPQGNTSLIPATTTATAAIQPSTGNISGCRVKADAACLIAFGVSTATAVLPTTSTPANGIPLLAGSAETFQTPPNFWISAITTSGTALIHVTPGVGI